MLEEIKKTINTVLKNQELVKKYKQNKFDVRLFQAVLNTSLWRLSDYQKQDINLVNQALNDLNVVILQNAKLEKFNPDKHEKLS
jgi:hypothetical protein